MAKKNDNDAAIGFVLLVIFFLAVGAFFLIKWAIIGLIVLISTIVVWIINISKKQNKKIQIKNMVDNSFNDYILKPVSKISRKELKQKLGLFDIDIYDDLFEPKIRPRGQAYFADRKIENAQNKDNFWSCEVVGNERYKVSIKFDEDKIIETNCTCPYHNKEDNKNCKHIYALLIKAKCEWNLPKILEAIAEYSNRVTKMVKEETEYIRQNQNSLKLKEYEITAFDNDINAFMGRLTDASKSLEKNKYNERILLDILISIIENSYKFNKHFESMLTKTGKVENPVSISKVYNSYSNNNNRLKVSDVILGAAVANEIDKHIHKKDDDYDEELEKEMDEWGLDDDEKELVRSGEYQVDEFEWGPDLTEDDYYYEEYNEENDDNNN